jgi:predicted PurR-regulated permease PerM
MTMLALTGRDWAVIAFVLSAALVLFVIAVVIANLFRVVTSLKDLVDGITSETVPLINEVGGTVRTVNKELERVDSIVGSAQKIASNVESISDTVHATVTNPLVKGLAFLYGVKRGAKKFKEDDK